MFRRQRAARADKTPADENVADLPAADDDSEDGPRVRGPWDVAESYPDRERVDLGSLRVPSRGLDVRLSVSGEQAFAVFVVRGDSALQLQAFAAPKRSGIWADIRHELLTELTTGGGRAEEAHGPFGVEVHARVPAETGGAGTARGPRNLQPVRFLGVDGPRWFLQGVITGSAASHAKLAEVFEDVFADIVVVRGDHPVPPRDLLELRLPAEMQQALEEQMAQAGARSQPLNPFARGPEITETR